MHWFALVALALAFLGHHLWEVRRERKRDAHREEERRERQAADERRAKEQADRDRLHLEEYRAIDERAQLRFKEYLAADATDRQSWTEQIIKRVEDGVATVVRQGEGWVLVRSIVTEHGRQIGELQSTAREQGKRIEALEERMNTSGAEK